MKIIFSLIITLFYSDLIYASPGSKIDSGLREALVISDISHFNPEATTIFYGDTPIEGLQEVPFFIVAESLLKQDISQITQEELNFISDQTQYIKTDGKNVLSYIQQCLLELESTGDSLSIKSIFYTISTAIISHRTGNEFQKTEKSFGHDFLTSMGITENLEQLAELFDCLMVLHAEHELNASTFTTRQIASTDASMTQAIIGAMSALSGPKHGGANVAVLDMLDEIESVEEFIEKVKLKECKLMGVGHAVYKTIDPRAVILKKLIEANHSILDLNQEHLRKLRELEAIIESDEYFTSRRLYPNVDFYSGIIFEAMGIDRKYFTALFALARSVGWMAHYNEQTSGKNTLMRPRAITTAEAARL